MVTAVLFTAVLGLGGIMVSRQLERDLSRQVRLASDGRELETLVEAAIEDAHYQLVIGAKPAGDSGAAKAQVLRAAGKGVEATDGSSTHDAVNFLRDATEKLHFAPVVTAGGMEANTGIELSGVEIEVIDRRVGAWQGAPASGPTADGPAGNAAPGELPTLFTALRTTWGVLELRAHARWPRGRGPVATRRLTVRRLFTVVDHVFDRGAARGYAHVFDGSIARVMEAE